MADKADKQFDPTPRRIQKAREEGNVFRSQETTAVGMLVIGVSVIVIGGRYGFSIMEGLMTDVFLSASQTPVNVASVPSIIQQYGLQVALILMPFFGVLVAAALGLNVLQTGWNITLKPLVPKPNRISPLSGFKRIFSAQGAFSMLKSVLKIAIVGPIAYFNVQGRMPEILMLHTLPLQNVLGAATTWILVLLAQMIIVLALMSAADFAFEKWRYKRDLKMDKQELKDEAKEQEGDAQVKGKRREKAREIARRPRLDHAVMKADVVVTNPTHYAVALRYAPEEGDAPRVLAKGIRKRALRIKELAREHGIPMIEDRPLARALYASVREEQEIPEDLYPAVAAILAEIYRKQNRSV